MIKKKVLIFGSTGQIGKHLIRKLTKNNYKVICQTRNSHKAIFLKSSGSIGYIDIQEANIFDIEKIESLISEIDVCVNLIGILYEKGKLNTFKRVHEDFPNILSEICSKYNKDLVHISALSVENANDSLYALSKYAGENKIKKNLKRATIIKPSVVFSVDDNFTTRFMSLLNILPLFPLYYNGNTKFTPIHASDLANLIFNVISNEITSKEIEAIGPEVLTFKQMIEIILKCIGKKRLLIPLPLIFAKSSARFFQMFPNPLLTIDQLKLLKYDNIKSLKGISNFDINFPSKISFEEGLMKYAYNWREGGQFSISHIKKNK